MHIIENVVVVFENAVSSKYRNDVRKSQKFFFKSKSTFLLPTSVDAPTF